MNIHIIYFITVLTIIHIQTAICYELKNKENVNRIVGGTLANEKQYPWFAAIAVQKAKTLALCGGSLISRQWVLTSAQCIDDAEVFSIGIGKVNLDDYETINLLVSTTGIMHEEYNNFTLQHDIGLIKLPKLLVFSDRINATRLPSRKLSTQKLDDRTVYISGHGRNEGDDITPNLTSVEANTITLDRCIDYYGREAININVICSTATEGIGPCFNDTGDPLIMYEADGYATQIGIFSYFHEEGCELGYPSVYTRVGRYVNWIYNKTGIMIVEDDGNNSNLVQMSNFVIILSIIITFNINIF